MSNPIVTEMTALVREESRYASELWTVLQELRVWAACEGIELPAFAKPNRAFYHDRMEEICERHRRIDALINHGEVDHA
jgi:hypothetical protein